MADIRRLNADVDLALEKAKLSVHIKEAQEKNGPIRPMPKGQEKNNAGHNN